MHGRLGQANGGDSRSQMDFVTTLEEIGLSLRSQSASVSVHHGLEPTSVITRIPSHSLQSSSQRRRLCHDEKKTKTWTSLTR